MGSLSVLVMVGSAEYFTADGDPTFLSSDWLERDTSGQKEVKGSLIGKCRGSFLILKMKHKRDGFFFFLAEMCLVGMPRTVAVIPVPPKEVRRRIKLIHGELQSTY